MARGQLSVVVAIDIRRIETDCPPQTIAAVDDSARLPRPSPESPNKINVEATAVFLDGIGRAEQSQMARDRAELARVIERERHHTETSVSFISIGLGIIQKDNSST